MEELINIKDDDDIEIPLTQEMMDSMARYKEIDGIMYKYLKEWDDDYEFYQGLEWKP